MADYIFIRKSRNALSSVMHVLLNLALAMVSIGATVITGNCLIGLILIIVSKWRIFAVNHRYWFLNIRSSLVDFIVGAGFVLLAYAAGQSFLPVHFLLMGAYAVWLIILKPRSSTNFAIVQALTAVLVGSTAASVFAAITDDNIMSLILVVSEFLIGYAASNHVLVQASDTNPTLISLAVGLVFAEIAWLSHVWLIIYTIGTTGICFSQLALILTILAFAYFQVYNDMAKHKGKLTLGNVSLPLIFCAIMIIALVVGFSQPRFSI